jgi:outer membrane protein assembly factor BamB
VREADGRGISFSAEVSGADLYVAESGRVDAFRASNGAHLWSLSIGASSELAVDPNRAVFVAGTYKHASELVALKPSTGAVLWSQPLSGLYRAPILVSNHKVYVAQFTGTIYAYEAASGSKLWHFSTHDSFVPSMLASQGVVYAGGPNDGVQGNMNAIVSLNGSTGHKNWQWSARAMGGAAPLGAFGGRLLASQGDLNEVFALNSSHGTLLWAYPTDRGVDAAPLVSGSTVYAGSDDTRVYKLRASNGTVSWSRSLGGPVPYTPVLLGQRLFAVTGYPDNSLHALHTSTGKPLWSHAFKGDLINAAPVTTKNAVIVATEEHVYAFNPATGKVRWTHSHPPDAEVYSMLATFGGTVFAVSTADAHAHVTALSSSNGHSIWSFDTQGGDGPMASANGVLYIPGRNRVFALRATTGKPKWTHTTTDSPFPSIVVAGHTVYVGAETGNIDALSTGKGQKLWTHAIGGPVRTQAIQGSTLYAGANKVTALRPATGHVLWSSTISDGTAVAKSAGNLYVGALGPRYGGVYKLDERTGHQKWSFATARSPL